MDRRLIFIIVLTIILSLSSWYISVRFIKWMKWPEKSRMFARRSFIVFLVLVMSGVAFHRLLPAYTSSFFTFYWIIYLLLGIFSYLLVYTVSMDVLLQIWQRIAPSRSSVNLERRSLLTVGALTVGSTLAGSAEATLGPRVYEVDVPLKNLPTEFEGFRIVQITDLHVGPTIRKEYAERVTRMVNELNPDIVALTGDFVDGTIPELQEHVHPLSHIKTKHGMFFVTGNHEYYWGAQEWIEEFKRLGARVLMNEHVVIQKGGQQIVLAGVTDYTAAKFIPEHATDPAKSIEGAPGNTLKILLAHQPTSYIEASKAGFDLQLSGHTHGGQFFPLNLVVSLIHRYYKGLNRHENMWVYVSRGTGYWGPPLRFAVPSEITLLRLKRA